MCFSPRGVKYRGEEQEQGDSDSCSQCTQSTDFHRTGIFGLYLTKIQLLCISFLSKAIIFTMNQNTKTFTRPETAHAVSPPFFSKIKVLSEYYLSIQRFNLCSIAHFSFRFTYVATNQ